MDRNTLSAGWLSAGWIVGMLAWAAVAAADERREIALAVTLCDAGSLPAPLARELAAESSALWRAAGVALRVTATHGACEAPTSEPLHIMVRVNRAARQDCGSSRRAIACIVFRDGRPEPTVVLSLHAALSLMAEDPTVRTMVARVTQRRADLWTGRMLGRALAHEIGHYLLRTPEHTKSGLMRATQTAADLIRDDRGPFRVTEAQRRLVLAVHAPPALAEIASARE